MTWIDWAIVALPWIVILGVSVVVQKHVKGVADFLAGGRCAGRYLVCVAEGVAGFGLITAVAVFEMNYKAGTAMSWWSNIGAPVGLLMTLTGFVIYRFRQTRALTMAQFMEVRYSKRFRIFMGIMAWISGVINYAIFPAVGARFFIYYCDLPDRFNCLGASVSMYAFLLFIFIAGALFITLVGGQIQVMVTDCVQGMFSNVMFVIVAFAVLSLFSFDQIYTAMANRPAGESLLNPFDTTSMKDFNIWYVLIGVLGSVYGCMSWQGNSGYNASALNPHEAKMGRIISVWRGFGQGLLFLLLALAAITFMTHPDFATGASSVRHVLDTRIDSSQIREQMLVPVAISHFLPIGIKGMFAAIMLFLMVTTDDTYLHSWGSIFIQDVIVPLRRKPLSPKQHMALLRWSITFVAVFAYFFSLLFKQTDYILMFFAITGTIFLGGSGSAIIGGLYWKKGTTGAAWVAMIAGSGLGVAGILISQLWSKILPALQRWKGDSAYLIEYAEKFPINGQVLWFIAMCASVLLYVGISLLTSKEDFDMDRMLHRGKYAVKSDQVETAGFTRNLRNWKKLFLGFDENFTRGDRFMAVALFTWSMVWFVAFVVITTLNAIPISMQKAGVDLSAYAGHWYSWLLHPWTEKMWWNWTLVSIWLSIILAPITTIWFTWGGTRDLYRLFQRLKVLNRDVRDDGTVVGHRNLADEPMAEASPGTDAVSPPADAGR